MPTLRIGLVIGSLRAGSFNRQLADAVRTLAGDRFVFEEIGIGDIEEAFEKMHGGDVLRSVVVL